MTARNNSEDGLVEGIIERLVHVEPKLREEPQAYKRAIMRMAIAAYMEDQDMMIRGALERHG